MQSIRLGLTSRNVVFGERPSWPQRPRRKRKHATTNSTEPLHPAAARMAAFRFRGAERDIKSRYFVAPECSAAVWPQSLHTPFINRPAAYALQSHWEHFWPAAMVSLRSPAWLV